MISKKELRKQIYDHITNGKVTYSQLNDRDREIISSTIIRSLGHSSSKWEYITEADILDELPDLLHKYMESRNEFLGQKILDKLVLNAVKYSSDLIEKILEEQYEEYKFNMKETNGYKD